ncbi:DNase I-like protein [Biscogniauxia marginata]|nr:DNase I-like protein [Biscogniauxia marginata]
MACVDSLPTQVNILTLNCWGIPYVCPERSNRLLEIGRRIVQADPAPHIVGLQECFSREDFERIRQETRNVLPYAKYYSAATFGTGLVILSCWPIEETSMFRYPLNGSPTVFYHGDWYVGKGVAYAKIRYGQAPDHVIDVLNTHMHASYPGDEYLCHRLGQAWEFGKILRFALQRRHYRTLVVALGDLNAEPTSLPWRIVRHLVPDMLDTWVQSPLRCKLQPGSGQRGVTTQNEEISIRDGATYGSPYNTWMWTRDQRRRYLEQLDIPHDELILPTDASHSEAIRIDYVLANVAPLPLDKDKDDSAVNPSLSKVGSEEEPDITNNNVTHGDGLWTVKTAKVGMLDRHPTLGCSLSDHFSVEVTLMFGHAQRESATTSQELFDESSSPSSNVSTSHRNGKHSDYHSHVPQHVSEDITSPTRESLGGTKDDGVLDEMLHVLSSYQSVRQKRAWWARVRLGVLSVVSIGSLVGVGLIDGFGWARSLLALAGILASCFAVLDACRRLLFDLAEGAALRELEWEVRNRNESH